MMSMSDTKIINKIVYIFCYIDKCRAGNKIVSAMIVVIAKIVISV